MKPDWRDRVPNWAWGLILLMLIVLVALLYGALFVR